MSKSRYSWCSVRVTLLALLSAVFNIVFLLTAASPNLTVELYRVNVTKLANNLHVYVLNDTAGLDIEPPEPPIVPPELPTYWVFGISGVCDVFNSTGTKNVYCRRDFGPTQKILEVVDASLRASVKRKHNNHTNQSLVNKRDAAPPLESDEAADNQNLINAVLSSWNATLNLLHPTRMDQRIANIMLDTSAGTIAAAATLDLLAFITSLLACYGKAATAWALSLFAIGVIFALVGAAAAFRAMQLGIHSVAGNGSSTGWIVFVVVALASVSDFALLSYACFPARRWSMVSQRHGAAGWGMQRRYQGPVLGGWGWHAGAVMAWSRRRIAGGGQRRAPPPAPYYAPGPSAPRRDG
ncbi:hypothetical protein VTJ04DRAFT_7578 [Mycothermus thermophilus]|uniref:uncharacterized protein n=1 Tax=Humicola insolens TaxID=85995 RepID=UPI0037427351